MGHAGRQSPAPVTEPWVRPGSAGWEWGVRGGGGGAVPAVGCRNQGPSLPVTTLLVYPADRLPGEHIISQLASSRNQNKRRACRSGLGPHGGTPPRGGRGSRPCHPPAALAPAGRGTHCVRPGPCPAIGRWSRQGHFHPHPQITLRKRHARPE